MAPRSDDVGVVLPKSTPVEVPTPQEALFAGGPFRRGEIVVHSLGATLNVGLCVAALVLSWGPVALAPAHVAVVVVAALVGWFVADLVSGILHWAFDTWFSEKVAAVRRMVLIVREHHIYPQHIFKYRWTQEVGIMSWFGALAAAAAVAVALAAPGSRILAPAVSTAAVVASAGITFSLEVHKVGHRFSAGPAVRVLQRFGLVLTPAHHMRHHAGEHDVNYCIVNGWADRTLGRLGLFRLLERVVGAAPPADPPRSDDRAWRRAFGRPVED